MSTAAGEAPGSHGETGLPVSIAARIATTVIGRESQIAVRTIDRSVTFGEIASVAGGVQAALRRLGGDGPVVLHAHDGIDVAAGAVGIIAEGRAVVLALSERSSEDVHDVITRTGAAAVVGRGGHDVAWSVPWIDLDTIADATLDPVPVSEDDLVYIGLTSGSTGRPKAIRRTHRTMVRDMTAERRASFPDGALPMPGDRLGVMLAGTAIVLKALLASLADAIPVSVFDPRFTPPARIADGIRDHEVTFLRLVPSLWRRLVESAPDGLTFDAMRTVSLYGEPVRWSDVMTVRSVVPETCVVANQYGSSELGGVTSKVVRHADALGAGVVPVGRPVGGWDVWVDAGEGRRAAPGEIGELVVEGAMDLVAAVGFGDDVQFERLPDGQHRFRTGDVGRLDESGDLELLGRLDRMVKIGGARIEPVVVEDLIRRVDGVRDVAVVARPDASGELRLVAHVVLAAGSEVSRAELRRAVTDRVSRSATPGLFVLRTEPLPLLPAGKVDLAALADADPDAWDREFVAPADELEVRVAGCVSEVLGVGRVGVTEDFFDLGGDSLRAQRLCGVLARRRVADLPASVVFEHPTVRGLAGAIRSGVASGWSSVVPLRVEGSRPPLVCFHAWSGEGILYAPLAEHLGADQPVYAVQSETLTGRPPRWRTVEEMAAGYCEQLVELVPEGPYLLFGQSFGGLVALEAGRWLRGSGRDVALVAMGDTVAPGRRQRRGRRSLRWILRGDHRTVRRLRTVRSRVRLLVGQRVKVAVTRGCWILRRPVPLRWRSWYIGWFISEVTSAYRPEPLDGRIVYFRATATPDPEPLRGWEFAADQVDVVELDCDHFDVVRGDQVPITAALLREQIDRVLGHDTAGT